MSAENSKTEVDALYILESGTTFHSKALYPHENFITLKWQNESKSDDDDLILEFVYFGHYKNRLIYHSIQMEEIQNFLY